MKKLFRFALCAFALLAVLTLRAQSEAPNFPLPVRPDTLRILGVGNSFTDDGMMYLPELLEAARSEERRVGKECRSRWSPYH